MEIISHRGYWKYSHEKNMKVAFERSFSLGLGTETDVRDLSGNLVISHDMPLGQEMSFSGFLELYKNSECDGTLAINIKADGLHEKILEQLSFYNIKNYFVFDMSIPDTLVALKYKINVFSRYSEIEFKTELWDKSEGIWYDSFFSNNIDIDLISGLLDSNKKVCIVSSELHKRNNEEQWSQIKKLPKSILMSSKLILCTDLPELALEYFNDCK